MTRLTQVRIDPNMTRNDKTESLGDHVNMSVVTHTMSISAERKTGMRTQLARKTEDCLDLRIPSETVNGDRPDLTRITWNVKPWLFLELVHVDIHLAVFMYS